MNTPKTRPLWTAAHAIVALTLLLAPAPTARSAVEWTASFEDPDGPVLPHANSLLTNLFSAAADWASHFIGSDAILDLLIKTSSSIPTATGRSVTSSFLYHNAGIAVWEQGAAAEIRRGHDPNGVTADIELTFGLGFLNADIWWDPDPYTRSTPVPHNRVDGYSVLLHEIGHALGFNGWRDPVTGQLGSFGSNFDELTVMQGSNFFFNGPVAVEVYGGPVPLTHANIFHLGNRPGRPGNDLVSDLMNGVTFFRGRRYEISQIGRAHV